MDTSRSQHRRSTRHDPLIEGPGRQARKVSKLAMAANVGAASTNSHLLDQAYEEYCELRENDDSVDKSMFVDRYPDIKHSLIRRIEVHEYLADVDFGLEESDLKEVEPGDTLFSSFRVIEKLGHGALGHVFLCEQEGLGNRQAVVKVAFRGAYEAETQGRLSHPNIMPVYSVHENRETQRSGICMPFYGRSTLCDVMDLAWKDETVPRNGDLIGLASRRWTQESDRVEKTAKTVDPDKDYVDMVLRIGLELAGALVHSHDRGVRHDDLKPSNILVGVHGRAMLLDFNLSSHDEGRDYCGGTLPYMSPEQVRRIHSPEQVIDNRSDIFSFGILLYELLAGRRPFRDPVNAPNAAQLAEHVEHLETGKFVAPSTYNSDVDEALDNIIRRCLRFRPEDRYPDMQSLRSELEEFRTRRKSVTRRWPAGWAILSVGIVAVIVMTAGLWWASGAFDNRDNGPAVPSVQQGALAPADSAASQQGWARFGVKFAEAKLQIEEGKYNEGATILDTCIEIDAGPAHAALASLAKRSSVLMRKDLIRHHSEMAIACGFENVAVLSNYSAAYAHMKDYEVKQRLLDTAIARDPDVVAPYCLRAYMDIARYLANNGPSPRGSVTIPMNRFYLPYAAAADILRVRERFPENGRIAARTAYILAELAKYDDRYRDELLRALRDGRLAGNFTPTSLRHGNFSWLRDDPRYQEILELETDATVGHRFSTTMDPLDESQWRRFSTK